MWLQGGTCGCRAAWLELDSAATCPWHTAPLGSSAPRSFPAGAEAELKASSLGPAWLFVGCGAGGATVAAGSASPCTGLGGVEAQANPFPLQDFSKRSKATL